MMIRTVRIRGFKRFAEVEFRLPGHVVLAGPNNTGKTTMLQAIASWSLALKRWRELNDFNRRRGFTRAPIARQAFAAVPLRSFDLLWTDRNYRGQIEIELELSPGGSVGMEFRTDSTEQIYVRPKATVPAETLRKLDLDAVFIPPMTGLSTEEPVFQPPMIEHLLGLGRPGEVLRNLLVETSRNEYAWNTLQESIRKLFGYILLPPDASGAHIRTEYTTSDEGPALDIASAGSGFQQVLMLLTFLNTRIGAVLLLDEPDAHLHVILQDAIYRELRVAAARHRSQLIIATHSEVVINSVEPRELCVILNEPKMVANNEERSRLISSLRVLSNVDIMQALGVRGILYVEGYTDINILRAWAKTLKHRTAELLTNELMWKPVGFQTNAREHFEALQLARVPDGLPGLELLDGDAHPDIRDTEMTGTGLQRLRWRRYEIESYLIHPDALSNFVQAVVGVDYAPHVDDMLDYMQRKFPPDVFNDPLGDHEFLNVTKARTRLIPPSLEAAGIHDLPYTRYDEIAAGMFCRAFGVEP